MYSWLHSKSELLKTIGFKHSCIGTIWTYAAFDVINMGIDNQSGLLLTNFNIIA